MLNPSSLVLPPCPTNHQRMQLVWRLGIPNGVNHTLKKKWSKSPMIAAMAHESAVSSQVTIWKENWSAAARELHMRGIAGARLSPGNQKGEWNWKSGDYRLASSSRELGLEAWNPGDGMRRVGAVAPAAGRKREDNPHSLQPCVSGHGGIGGRRSSGRGKVQAAIHWAVSKNISFLTNEALLLKLPTMNQADTWDYVLRFPWAKV